VDSRPWHAGYFAEEGEFYEWEEDEEDERSDGLDPFDDLRRKLPDPDDLDAIKGGKPQSTTSIAATPYGLAVLASLVADMQRQFGVLPKNLGYGLEPIYSPTHASTDLLQMVVATTEDVLTSFGPRVSQPSRPRSRPAESRGESTRGTFSDQWATVVEIGVAALAGAALIHLFPPGGGKGGAGLHFRWMPTGPNIHIARKVAGKVAIEAKFEKSMAEIGSPEAIGLYNV
jgi:hypothetical protein